MPLINPKYGQRELTTPEMKTLHIKLPIIIISTTELNVINFNKNPPMP